MCFVADGICAAADGDVAAADDAVSFILCPYEFFSKVPSHLRLIPAIPLLIDRIFT